MKRHFNFCNCCCSECYRVKNNSWGDVGVYYQCKKSGHYKETQFEWDKLEVPEDCIMKLEYTTFSDEIRGKVWRKVLNEQEILELENIVIQLEGQVKRHKEKIKKIKQKMAEDE